MEAKISGKEKYFPGIHLADDKVVIPNNEQQFTGRLLWNADKFVFCMSASQLNMQSK